ncbi:MAG TPA: hypothetical protein VHL78_08720 [Actinomycetota bacterium]|nr:hypothetical protein [Actinomycetota bacterium]
MTERDESKAGESADPTRPQPEAAEVESAHLLANQARPHLKERGFSDQEIRELADRYVAEDRGQDLGDFVEWAARRGRPGGSGH